MAMSKEMREKLREKAQGSRTLGGSSEFFSTKLPDGVKKQEHVLRFLPGKDELDIFWQDGRTHYFPDNTSGTCPACRTLPENLKIGCPVCSYFADNFNTFFESKSEITDLWKSFKGRMGSAHERIYFNVYDYGEEKFKVWGMNQDTDGSFGCVVLAEIADMPVNVIDPIKGRDFLLKVTKPAFIKLEGHFRDTSNPLGNTNPKSRAIPKGLKDWKDKIHNLMQVGVLKKILTQEELQEQVALFEQKLVI